MGEVGDRMAAWEDTALGLLVAAAERMPRISRDEELDLARRYQLGDRAAADRLITCHLSAVIKMARRYRGYGIPVDDLVGEGNIGLVEAVRRFEPERGLRFLTYARHWIRARILRHVLRQRSLVSAGTSAAVSRLFFGLQREHARLATELGSDEAAIEARLASLFAVPPQTVRGNLARLRSRDLSLDAPIGDEGSLTHIELLASDATDPQAAALAAESLQLLHDAIANTWATMNDRERLLLRERLLPVERKACSLANLGSRIGVSRERMRQIELGVKAKLQREYARLAELPRTASGCS